VLWVRSYIVADTLFWTRGSDLHWVEVARGKFALCRVSGIVRRHARRWVTSYPEPRYDSIAPGTMGSGRNPADCWQVLGFSHIRGTQTYATGRTDGPTSGWSVDYPYRATAIPIWSMSVMSLLLPVAVFGPLTLRAARRRMARWRMP
jgi:hypothetical protein